MPIKICGACRKEKDLDNEFSKQWNGKDGRQNKCKECYKLYYKLRRAADVALYNAQTKQRMIDARNRIVLTIFTYLQTHPCKECGQHEPLSLGLYDASLRHRSTELIANPIRIDTLYRRMRSYVVLCGSCVLRVRRTHGGMWTPFTEAPIEFVTERRA